MSVIKYTLKLLEENIRGYLYKTIKDKRIRFLKKKRLLGCVYTDCVWGHMCCSVPEEVRVGSLFPPGLHGKHFYLLSHFIYPERVSETGQRKYTPKRKKYY